MTEEVNCCGLAVFSREWPSSDVAGRLAGWRSGGMPDEWRRWFRYCMILIMFSTRALSTSAFGSSYRSQRMGDSRVKLMRLPALLWRGVLSVDCFACAYIQDITNTYMGCI